MKNAWRSALRITAAAAVAACAGGTAACLDRPAAQSPLRFALSFAAAVGDKPLDGRMLLFLSTDNKQEPRFEIGDNDATQQVFGVDVEGLKPGQEATFDGRQLGYPVASLSSVPPGEYWVQGLLHVYETFQRSDGHTVKLPADRGEGQQWASAPGNLYSTPKKSGSTRHQAARSTCRSTRKFRRCQSCRKRSTSNAFAFRASD